MTLKRSAALAVMTALAIGCAVPPASARAQAPAPATAAETGLAAAEDARFAALVRHDIPAISASLADELMFGHLTGFRVDKARFMEDITSGKLPYHSIVPRDRVVRVFGEVGITRGVVDMVVGERHLSDSYLAVYRRQAGRWQLLDWQSAAPPPKPGEHPWVPGMPPPEPAPK